MGTDNQEPIDRIMLSARANEVGWFDRLFAYLLSAHLTNGDAFTRQLVGDVFAETGRLGNTDPTARDQLDIKEIFEALVSHVDRLTKLRQPEQDEEVFRLIYRP